MKFEHILNFINNNFFFKIFFLFFFFLKLINSFYLSLFQIWKISSYADSYWFLYSNKKSLWEFRYF